MLLQLRTTQLGQTFRVALTSVVFEVVALVLQVFDELTERQFCLAEGAAFMFKLDILINNLLHFLVQVAVVIATVAAGILAVAGRVDYLLTVNALCKTSAFLADLAIDGIAVSTLQPWFAWDVRAVLTLDVFDVLLAGNHVLDLDVEGLHVDQLLHVLLGNVKRDQNSLLLDQLVLLLRSWWSLNLIRTINLRQFLIFGVVICILSRNANQLDLRLARVLACLLVPILCRGEYRLGCAV